MVWSRRAQSRMARSMGSRRSLEKVSRPARRTLSRGLSHSRSIWSMTSSTLSRSQVSSIPASSASRSAK